MSRQNASIRGYILRLLVKGRRNSVMVRRISNDPLRDGLIGEPDIWAPLKYLADMGLIEFTDVQITPYTAFACDGVARLTTKGVRFIENGGSSESGIDLNVEAEKAALRREDVPASKRRFRGG